MAFYGQSFTFDETPCEAFDLMLYDIGGEEQGETVFASTVSIMEEVVGRRPVPYFYGVKFDEKLEFQIVFGVNQHRLNGGRYLDRYEMDAVATWLTGHDQYRWLTVQQDDMTWIRYKCMVTELRVISFGQIPWAMMATITCNGPYAYMYPCVYEYTVSGETSFQFYNDSSMNGYYYPIIELELSGGGNFELANDSDNGRAAVFTDVPDSVTKIQIDNDHCVITNDQDLNLYPYFNMKFFRLKRGHNTIRAIGNGTLRIICEFPVNPGG